VIGFYHPNSGWEAGRDNAFSENAVLKCPLKTVEHCIDEVFEPLFTALSGLVARYKCDLLIVSGKPSELNRLYKLIRHTFPLMPQRIIRIKDYPAGNWYPSEFATVNDFKITDAKTCTVVGAALYQDIKHNHIAGFGVKLDATEQFQRNAYWGIIPKPKSNHDFFENLLFRPEQYPPEPRVSSPVECLEKESLAVTLNAAGLNRIGRQLVNDKKIKPAPVYVLVWDRKVEEAEVLEAEVRIVFRWRCFKGKGDMLEIASVVPQPGCPAITKADLRLELSTLMPDSENEDEEFWLDRPRLKVTLSNK
jgi:hypothetical protein